MGRSVHTKHFILVYSSHTMKRRSVHMEEAKRVTVADVGGTPMAQNFLNFMQFFGKFSKIVCWRAYVVLVYSSCAMNRRSVHTEDAKGENSTSQFLVNSVRW